MQFLKVTSLETWVTYIKNWEVSMQISLSAYKEAKEDTATELKKSDGLSNLWNKNVKLI